MTVATDNTSQTNAQFNSVIHTSVDNMGLTMSTLEIGGLTGKRHGHILRDTRKMLKALDFQPTQFWVGYLDAKGEERDSFNLPKRETLILVSGYSVEMRARIIDRWMTLEAAIAASALPKDATVTAIDPAVTAIFSAMMKTTVHAELATVLPGMVENALVADVRAVAIEYKPALSILLERKVPAQKRRGFSQKVSSRLRKFSTKNGLPMRLSRETGRYLFHVDTIARWMAKEGKALIADHLRPESAQTQLNLVVPIKRA